MSTSRSVLAAIWTQPDLVHFEEPSEYRVHVVDQRLSEKLQGLEDVILDGWKKTRHQAPVVVATSIAMTIRILQSKWQPSDGTPIGQGAPDCGVCRRSLAGLPPSPACGQDLSA